MPRILIMGATGMLGHELWRAARERGDASATVRGASADGGAAVLGGVDAQQPQSVARALDAVRPDVVVNCIGVVKQIVGEPAHTIHLNALFPHVLAGMCAERGARLVHVSTDCVFSGRRGGYTEQDLPDPVDLYGRSKLAGEPAGPHVLTLRTSMIGWELGGRTQGLLEWFVSERGGAVSGFTRALFSGPTTPVLARAILVAIDHELTGVWHVAAAPIAKHDLLVMLRAALGLEIEIAPEDRLVIDRSLDAGAFRARTGWAAPDWESMIEELAATSPPRVRGERVARR